MEIWDGYFRDGSLSGIDLIRGNEIPKGQYHIVCEVLVRHIDGDYLLMQRDSSKQGHPGLFEATAGGSAIKGEDKRACVKRELFEETGIVSDEFQEIAAYILDEEQCFYYSFLCLTDWNKEKITLQTGETMSYKWINEKDFIKFLNSNEIIESQKNRYQDYFKEKAYLK